jgi:peroxiredoxin/mono/diheme cytochrome c family protein
MTPQLRPVGRHSLLLVMLVGVMSAAPIRAADPAPMSDLTLRAADGTSNAWKDLAGKNATIVVFLSFDCPMCTGYAKTLADLAAASAEKGVKVVGFCPTDDEPAKVAELAAEYKFGFPIFKDDKLRAAAALGATTTPQVFVLNAKSEIQYRGLIDDSYSRRLVPNSKVTQQYLENALSEVLAGKAVTVAKTDPIGCRIAAAREPAKAGSGPVYYKDVLPILQNNCQVCHRPGEVGPFSLLTYKQAVAWADDIKEYTHNRTMPPWKPSDGKEFLGDRRLSTKDIDTLARWVDAGCMEGDPKDAPPAAKFTDGWLMGEPDLVLEAPGDFILGPTGKDIFRVFVLPTGLTEDKYVVAFDVRPGNPRIVHHTVNFYDITGAALKSQQLAQAAEKKALKPGDVDVGAGFTSGMLPGLRINAADLFASRPPMGPLGGWAPGVVPRPLTPGTGMLLPKGSDLVMQLHYHRNGRLEKDRTRIGLYFSKKPVDRPLLAFAVPGTFKTDKKIGDGLGYIPAGDRHFVARGSWYALEDISVHTTMPHMHLLGKSVKISMTPPGGKTDLIIDVPEWDYNWQELYFLKEPFKVPAGTRFDIEAVFDNSAANPRNPHDPPIDVKFGEQTTDEMLFGLFGVTKDHPKVGLPFVIAQGPFKLVRSK